MRGSRWCRGSLFALALSTLSVACSSQTGHGGPPDSGVTPGTLGAVQVKANRSSVTLTVPAFAGARDYRVYEDTSAVVVTKDAQGHEHIAGAVIHCAGQRQRNQCNQAEVLPVAFNNPLLDSPQCGGRNGRTPDVPTSVLQTIEVNGVTAGAKLVVEAVDRLCPFPGLLGAVHRDVKITGTEMPGTTEDAVVNGKAVKLTRWPATFPVRTADEIVADYGSMIYNGQGPNLPVLDPTAAAFPESPYIRLALPAPVNDPIVLAVGHVQVPALATALPDGLSPGDYFDDFEDPTDQPVPTRQRGNVPAWMENFSYFIALSQSKKWNFFDAANEFSDFFVKDGQLMMTMGDPSQDSMSSQSMYPKRPVVISDDPTHYLHVTYEVSHTETARRYEQFALCGSDQVGQTYVGEIPATAPVPRPGFMNAADTARTNPLGWNCLYLTPRGPGYGSVPGGDPNTHSDTTLRVTVVKTHPAPKSVDEYNGVHVTAFATEYGPTQEAPFPRTWERQVDAGKNPVGPWLDDQQNVWLRTKFDIFVSRSRVVVYVNGQARLCSNFASPLTMAEGALGLWHVMYHTSAEFTEMRSADVSSNQQTGQHHLLHNTPFGDLRNWDNVGFHENASLPAGFDPAACF